MHFFQVLLKLKYGQYIKCANMLYMNRPLSTFSHMTRFVREYARDVQTTIYIGTYNETKINKHVG